MTLLKVLTRRSLRRVTTTLAAAGGEALCIKSNEIPQRYSRPAPLSSLMCVVVRHSLVRWGWVFCAQAVVRSIRQRAPEKILSGWRNSRGQRQRELGDVGRDPPRFVYGEQLGRDPPRFGRMYAGGAGSICT